MSFYVLEKTVKKPAKKKAKLANTGRKFHDLKKENLKYKDLKGLHELWLGYMRSLLVTENTGKDDRLMKADYHGSLLLVAESSNPSQEGIYGIVARETKNAFMILTEKDRLLTIPKQGSVFQFALDGKLFSIFGDNFRFTAVGRMHKKTKQFCVPKLLR